MTPRLFDLTGRTAVVVGGTTGIGRALALGLADAGADVVATGRRPRRRRRRGRGDRGARAADAASSGRRRRPRVAARRCATRASTRSARSTSSSPPPASPSASPTLDMTEGRLEPDSRHQPHRHVAHLSGVRAVDDRARLRPADRHRLARVVRRPARSRGLHREQGGGRRADARAGGRVVAPRRHRERDRAGRLRNRLEPRDPERAARPGIPRAHADAPLRPGRGAGRRGGLPGVGRGDLRHRSAARRRRRLPRAAE